MNQLMTLGCISNKLMDTYAIQIFCINQWDHCCLIYHKKKMLIKYHYLDQRIIKQILWCKKKSYRIFDASMSKKHRLYFLLCQDWFIYFLNFDFQIVNKVQLECKQFTNLIYLDHKSTFIMTQFNQISAFEVCMKEKFQIIKYTDLPGTLEWNRQCKLIDYYYLLYNSQNISIYDLRNIIHIKTVKLGLNISDVYYLNELLYLGDIYGTLWCYDIKGILQYFHEHAHDGQIIGITVNKDELFTVANDLFIKVWKLKNLIFCQSYPINQQQIQYFKFINYSKYFIQSVDQLFLCDLNHMLQAYYLHNSSISAMSNYCIAFKNHVYYSNQTNKILFAPNSINQVLQIIDNPIENDTYYLFLSNQTLAKWVNNNQTDIYFLDKIRTINGDKLGQDITYIKICNIQPPLYDAEQTIDNKDTNKFEKIIDKLQTNLFFVMGCSKGAVIFVPLNQLTLVYTRINFNKNSISYLILLEDQLIIKSIDNVLNFISILPKKLNLIKTLKFNKLGPIHITNNNNLVLAQSNELYVFDNNQKAYDTNSGHENDIQNITSNSQHIITNSQLSLKIWNFQGFCKFTINFHVDIDYIYYLQNELILSLNGGLCKMPIPEQEDNIIIDTTEYMKIDLIDLSSFKKKNSIKADKDQLKVKNVIVQSEPSKEILKLQSMELPQIQPKIKRITGQILNHSTPRKYQQNTIQTFTNKNTNVSISHSQAPINKSLDYSTQFEGDNSCILPAIPKVQEDNSLLSVFLNRRTKKGQPRNRREWTLEKKIFQNILQIL